eukprot:5830422-Pyramimonas_sp.AAC.1
MRGPYGIRRCRLAFSLASDADVASSAGQYLREPVLHLHHFGQVFSLVVVMPRHGVNVELR